jgi:hypothetical protein
MDDPKQNIQPDFGFIVNQQLPEPKKSKGLDKRIVLIGILLLVMVFIVVGTALFSKDKQPSTPLATPEQTNTSQTPTATNSTVQLFITLMSNANNDSTQQIVDLLSADLKPDKAFAEASMRRIKTGVAFSTCRKEDGVTDPNLTRYTCQSATGAALLLAIRTQTVDNKSVITSIKVEPHA